jgi:hypothetical protein
MQQARTRWGKCFGIVLFDRFAGASNHSRPGWTRGILPNRINPDHLPDWIPVHRKPRWNVRLYPISTGKDTVECAGLGAIISRQIY